MRFAAKEKICHVYDSMSDPLGVSSEPTELQLTRFVGKSVAVPEDQDDIAEIGRLLASTNSRANSAFLATLVAPPKAPHPVEEADKMSDEDVVRHRA